MSEALSEMPGRPWIASAGKWTARDGGLWGQDTPKDKNGALLRTPCALSNGTIDFEINFAGANRHSLRIEAGDPQHTFRVVIARHSLEITRNPLPGEGADAAEQLVRKPLNLEKARWYPVRLTFQGNNLSVQVNDSQTRATNDIFAMPKTALNFLVFGESAGFRNLKIVR